MLKELVAEHIYPEAEGSDFYTTGLIRTEQTLTLIYGEKEHSVIEELREMNFGQFEMKSYQEPKKFLPISNGPEIKPGLSPARTGRVSLNFGNELKMDSTFSWADIG